ncbi:MAG: hypothetical protein FK732_04390 [Asgard group archaeon]|nr:hypothetical protein [Asgard group archaeon]
MKFIKIPHKVILEGTIVDFETTHWDVEKGELITAGYFSQNGFVIIQRLESTEEEFRKNIIEEMKNQEKPYYVSNKDFEESFCQLPLEKELQQRERESAFGALLEERLLGYYNLLCDPLFNEEVPRFWDVWKAIKDMVLVSKIIRHNYCCLCKEYYLKLKREDELEVNKINRFRSSALIEKNYKTTTWFLCGIG